MAPADVYFGDAYASYWHSIESELDDAPAAVLDADEPFAVGTPLAVIDAYGEFSSMSND